ncbi:hypothetical protein [Rathayibacter tritici]|uniref:hypothetical protein n=1 Tax=Rathayibacter tritici TaxID=33888 RepID=UPI00147283A3|nr:hypothetical protein [Rathayibacter tritici]
MIRRELSVGARSEPEGERLALSAAVQGPGIGLSGPHGLDVGVERRAAGEPLGALQALDGELRVPVLFERTSTVLDGE